MLNNGLGTNSLGSARVPTASVEIEGGNKKRENDCSRDHLKRKKERKEKAGAAVVKSPTC